MTWDPQLIKAYLSAQRPASLGWAMQPTQPIFIAKQKKNPNRNPTTIQYRDNLNQLLIALPLLGQLALEELVQLGVENTIGDELAALGAVMYTLAITLSMNMYYCVQHVCRRIKSQAS